VWGFGVQSIKAFFARVWRGFRPAFEELIVHFLITAVTLFSLAGVEWLLEGLHLAYKAIPRTDITLSEWMFYLDVLAVTGINIVGVYRALRVVLRG